MAEEKVKIPNGYAQKVIILKKKNPTTSWEDVSVGDHIHIPQLWAFHRRDLEVISKDDTEIKYKVIGTEKEQSFKRESIFAKIMVKKNEY